MNVPPVDAKRVEADDSQVPDEGEERPPSVEDFSLQSIRRHVATEALTHPATLYPGALGILGGVAGALFGSPHILLAGVAAALAGLASATVNYFFRDKKFAEEYLAQLVKKKERRQEQLKRSLREELLLCRNLKGCEDYAWQAVQQFDRIHKKAESFSKVVEEKFGLGELELGAASAAAEEALKGVIENLGKALTLMKNAQTVDEDYIFERLRKLAALKRLKKEDVRERDALLRRKQLRDGLLDRVNLLLTENEEALTVMDEALLAVSELEHEDAKAAVTLRTSIGRLQDLARQISERAAS
jgi:hypothetical protein